MPNEHAGNHTEGANITSTSPSPTRPPSPSWPSTASQAGDAEIIADETSKRVLAGLSAGVAGLYPQVA